MTRVSGLRALALSVALLLATGVTRAHFFVYDRAGVTEVLKALLPAEAPAK